jgi:hypothetical protein
MKSERVLCGGRVELRLLKLKAGVDAGASGYADVAPIPGIVVLRGVSVGRTVHGSTRDQLKVGRAQTLESMLQLAALA